MRYATILAAVAVAVNGLSFKDTVFELVEELRHVPDGWSKMATPAPSDRLHFRVAVKHHDPNILDQTLMAVSDPDSKRYGQHLKRDELKALLRPSADATQAIKTWLEAAGVRPKDVDDDGEWINFHATVAQAESMMHTTFATYRNEVNGAERVRSLAYSVPKAIAEHVDMIQPTTRFGQIRAQRSTVFEVEPLEDLGFSTQALNVTACNATITPQCLQDLYKINGYRGKAGLGDFLGINNFLEEYPRFNDLAAFEKEYAPYAVGKNFTYTLINGGLLDQNSADDSIEANLDMQYGISIGYAVNVNAYSTAGRAPLVPDLDQPTQPGSNEPYLDFLNYILRLPDGKLPRTLTTSYGEDEQSVPEKYVRQVCGLFGQLGARGVSVIFSSGDTGPGSACQTNDGKNTTRFLPIFPAACPYVTSVGGTYHVEPEVAIAFSSGGFSDLFPRPAYQELAVRGYLARLGGRWKGLYNPRGRGFPDVAAQSYRFHVVDKSKEILVGGTSAAAPTFAGVVALLNNARRRAGLPGLGFLNPWIYSVGRLGLTDITAGGSRGCTGTDMYSGLPAPYVPYASWNATPGWDPVTGYGTPDFQKLLRLAVPFPLWGKAGISTAAEN